MKVEEFFSEGFRLAKPEYWTIIFNCLIYLIVGIVALFSVVGWLALPSLAAGFTRFTLRAARGEERAAARRLDSSQSIGSEALAAHMVR